MNSSNNSCKNEHIMTFHILQDDYMIFYIPMYGIPCFSQTESDLRSCGGLSVSILICGF